MDRKLNFQDCDTCVCGAIIQYEMGLPECGVHNSAGVFGAFLENNTEGDTVLPIYVISVHCKTNQENCFSDIFYDIFFFRMSFPAVHFSSL